MVVVRVRDKVVKLKQDTLNLKTILKILSQHMLSYIELGLEDLYLLYSLKVVSNQTVNVNVNKKLF